MTQTTLTEVHQGIVTRLKAALPDVTVEVFSPTMNFAEKAPALLVELTSFPLAKMPATIVIRLIVASRFIALLKEQPLVDLWEMTASVAQLIYNNGFWVGGGVMEQ